jgi:hypothetical protein
VSTRLLQPGRATLFDIRTFIDARGTLSVVEGGVDLPFVPQRFYFIYGSGPGQARADHAHRTDRQCLITIAGATEIEVDDGRDGHSFVLDRPDQGLVLEPALWTVVRFRDAASVLAVLAAEPYDADDYIHEYEEFRSLVGAP